jgi:hypothetical protein
MAETPEPRALSAALASPAFVTRGGQLAMHVANRHVERWAPEAGAGRVRPLRSLGFVDRLVAPWLDIAQRSASLRTVSQYVSAGSGERPASTVSWLLPRPWFQDELNWMAAARMPQTGMLTTRGTFVPTRAAEAGLPAALYEYIAPSLARTDTAATADVYSPLVSHTAAQAAAVMSRALAPLAPTRALGPGMRAVLAAQLGRSAHAVAVGPTRSSLVAPELVTPPHPQALEVADRFANQSARLAELRRAARVVAEREARTPVAMRSEPASTSDVASERAARPDWFDERVAHGVEDRLHASARDAAARDARSPGAPKMPERAPRAEEMVAKVPAEIVAALAALPAELQSVVAAGIGARPDRAAQAISELGEALRTIELIARTTAAGGTFEATRGPRLMMPAGLGGLVATLDRTAEPVAPASSRVPALPMPAPRVRALGALGALGAVALAAPAALGHVAWADRWLARFAGAKSRSLDVLAASASAARRLAALASAAPGAVFVAHAEPPDPGERVVRFADDAETPDDVFAAISQAATRSRVAPPAASAAATAARTFERHTVADLVAHAVPVAPGAGFAAQLASSPFAPALRHLLPLAAAPTFDVRALFGGGVGATYLAGLLGPATPEIAGAPGFEYGAPGLTTIRSALLSATPEPTDAGDTATTLLRPMRLPTLGETAALHELGAIELAGVPARATSYASPGAIAERAQAWSVAQERSSADLAFDFVSPELVLAARVYGLGPGEAAQAARLAIAGSGQLAAMAGAIDRSFVSALAIERGRRTGQPITAYPASQSDSARASTSAFGVERRAPRGAFLWPAASVSALGLSAAMPDGDSSSSVAAVELLAAQRVVELGAFAVTSDQRGASTELSEPNVLASAGALIGSARRAKLEAVYVALGQSTATRAMSPAARAARAVALAGHGEPTITARERAAIAWDVLPLAHLEEPASTGQAAQRAAQRRELEQTFVAQPGLAALSARAGEALGSYVTPQPAAPVGQAPREHGAVLRAPSAAPELVRTGRVSGPRHGGGDLELPAWFEQAAKKMLSEPAAGIADGISLSELTLVTAAPSTHVAASTRTAPSAMPAPVATKAAEASQHLDIEKIANDVYRQILVIMDATRARNGEPYL